MAATRAYSGASGAAITVNTNGVILDLNGFGIYNSAGASTTATGIAVANTYNVTVRNGIVMAFAKGVVVNSCMCCTVNGLRFDCSTQYGVQLSGTRNCTVANCQLDLTGYYWSNGQPVTGASGIALCVNSGSAVWLNSIEHNRISSCTKGVQSLAGGVLINDNAVSQASTGVEHRPGDRLRDNVTMGVQNPYVAVNGGGDDLGGND